MLEQRYALLSSTFAAIHYPAYVLCPCNLFRLRQLERGPNIDMSPKCNAPVRTLRQAEIANYGFSSSINKADVRHARYINVNHKLMQ